MRKGICLLLVMMALIGCTAAPTPVPSTATATSTPAPTATVTPVPTPLGGGNGQLLIVADHELKTINADGTQGKVILGRGQFDRLSRTGDLYQFSKISPDGKKIAAVFCPDSHCFNASLVIHVFEPAHTLELPQIYKGGLLEWSPDSTKILIQGASDPLDKIVISDVQTDASMVLHLPKASAAFWSFDGAQIYYYSDGWHFMNSDGSNQQPLQCDVCSLVTNTGSFAVAASPDGQKVAIGYRDGTLIIANLDLTHLQPILLGGYISHLHWSPDGQKLAVDVNTTTDQSDVIIVGVDGAVITKLERPVNANYIATCGWSPDSQLIDYLAFVPTGYDLYFTPIEPSAPKRLMMLAPTDNTCPVWLSSVP